MQTDRRQTDNFFSKLNSQSKSCVTSHRGTLQICGFEKNEKKEDRQTPDRHATKAPPAFLLFIWEVDLGKTKRKKTDRRQTDTPRRKHRPLSCFSFGKWIWEEKKGKKEDRQTTGGLKKALVGACGWVCFGRAWGVGLGGRGKEGD